MKSFLLFKALPEGLFVRNRHDTGWNEGLDMRGTGGYEFTVTPEDGVAEIHFRSTKDSADDLRVVWIRGGMYFVQSKLESSFNTRMVGSMIRTIASERFVFPVTKGAVHVAKS